MPLVYLAKHRSSVRTITADFGFSFALPVAPRIAELALPTELPTKRRKTNDSISPKRHNQVEVVESKKTDVRAAKSVETLDTYPTAVQSENHPEQSNHGGKNTVNIATLPAERTPKPSKKSSKPRRKLDLSEEIEQRAQHDDGEVQSGGLEDTFIFGLKPKKRQARRKLEEEPAPEGLKQTSKKAPSKGRKTTKAKQHVEDQHGPDNATEPPAEIVISKEKPAEAPDPDTSKQTSKKAPRKGRKPTKAQQQNQEELAPDAATEPPAEPLMPAEKPKAPRKKPVAKTNVEITGTDSNTTDEAPIIKSPNLDPSNPVGTSPVTKLLVDETASPKPKPAKTKLSIKRANKRSIDEVVTSVEDASAATSEKATKRPRRQAAISAIEKVTSGYEEELVPVDKLRRAPDLVDKPRESRKANAPDPSAVAQPTPSSTQPVLATKEVGNCEKDQSSFSPPLTVRKARKAAVKTAELCNDKMKETLEVVDSQTATAPQPSLNDEDRVLEEELPPPQNLHAKRGRKPGVKATKATPATVNVILPETAIAIAEETFVPEEELPPPKLPAKRGRKPGVKLTKANSAAIVVKSPNLALQNADEDCMPDEDLPPPKVPAKRCRKPGVKCTKATPAAITVESLEPAFANAERDVVPGEVLPLPQKLPAKRGRKPGVKAAKAASAKINAELQKPALESEEQPPTACDSEESGQNDSKLRCAREDHKTKTKAFDFAAKAAGKSDRLADRLLHESDNSAAREQPRKTRRVLADFDRNIVRHAANSSASPPAKQQSSARGDRSTLPIKPKDIGCPKKAQPVEQPGASSNSEPCLEKPTSSKKRRVIATEEDLDWLFEKPMAKRSQPAVNRQLTTKSRRKEADHSAKDMDLDDLLASVAGFSGKLLTGKRGRAVAS